jgi:acetyltransferase-like isoleucine patch superfamily enzyme
MIHETAQISAGVFVSQNAYIGAGCHIAEGAFIGEGVVLEEGCRVERNAMLEGKVHAGPGSVFQTGVHIVDGKGEGLILGGQCIIRSFAVLYDDMVLGERVRVGHHSVLRPKCKIGDDVSIGNLNQLEGLLSVGSRTRFHSNVHISMYSEVGADCFIAPGFVPTNTPYPLTELAERNTPGVKIADAVKVGANVTTAPGVSIGRNSLIGLGSVVLHDVPADSFAAGNPCKVIKSIFELFDKQSGTYPYLS